jgi:hypothetical protein
MIQGRVPPLENLPRILKRRVCSKMIREDEESPLENNISLKCIVKKNTR